MSNYTEKELRMTQDKMIELLGLDAILNNKFYLLLPMPAGGWGELWDWMGREFSVHSPKDASDLARKAFDDIRYQWLGDES